MSEVGGSYEACSGIACVRCYQRLIPTYIKLVVAVPVDVAEDQAVVPTEVVAVHRQFRHSTTEGAARGTEKVYVDTARDVDLQNDDEMFVEARLI